MNNEAYFASYQNGTRLLFIGLALRVVFLTDIFYANTKMLHPMKNKMIGFGVLVSTKKIMA